MPPSCRLPAPSCQPPGVQPKRSALSLSLSLRPGVGGKPARRGRFSEINTGAGNSPLFKTRARRLRPGVDTSTGGGEGSQKSTQGTEIRLESKLLSGGSGPALTQAPAAGKVVRNHNRGRKFASSQNSCPGAPATQTRYQHVNQDTQRRAEERENTAKTKSVAPARR